MSATILLTMAMLTDAPAAAEPSLPPLQERIARPEGDLEATMVVVTLDPQIGDEALASQDGHRHPGHVLVYVLEGEVRSMLDDGAAVTYGSGEVWSEQPGQLHRIRNTSATAPARLLVVFLDPAEAGDHAAH